MIYTTSMTRVNLDQRRQNFIYLSLSLFFILVSGVGIFLIYHLVNPSLPNLVPTDSNIISIKNTPTPSIILSRIPSVKLSPTAKPSPVPTPEINQYAIDIDNFSVQFKSNRQVITDTEDSGNRYTFYRSDSSLAVHVGQTWSWQHPSREFSTSSLLLDGQPTFQYLIDTQKLVDAEFDGKKYTIQCIHNGIDAIKSECDQFIASFKFLK